MKTVLFVDDEVEVTEGLSRMFHRYRKKWNVILANSGEEALSIVEKDHVDILISDIKMPSMNGIELLGKVKESHPDIIRIVLTGYCDSDLEMMSTKLAHQFLVKPIGPKKLLKLIDRMLDLRDSLQSEQLLSIVTKTTAIPSLPKLYDEVTHEASLPNSCMKNMAKIIKQDPAMTSKILQMVNAGFFGIPKEVTEVEQAITILGINIIRSLILSEETFEKLKSFKNSSINVESVIRHCQSAAIITHQICEHEGVGKDEAEKSFMAAILHKVGKLILISAMDNEYREVVKLQKSGLTDVEAEHEIFGTTHIEVGAYLLGIWGLPFDIVEAVAKQNQRSSDPNELTIATIVYAASAIACGKSVNGIDQDKARQWLEVAQDGI